jgi:predicted nucleic-acid-binding protein
VIGLDTNILLRAVTGDDSVQSPIARRIVRSLSEERPGYISIVVLSEFVWSLDRRYKYSCGEVARAIEAIMASTSFVVAERESVSRALIRAEEHQLGFADALICDLALTAGCTTTVTFDRKAGQSPGFTAAT